MLSLSNWYVLQVKKTRELFIKKYINHIMGNEIRAIVFSREILHSNKGIKKNVIDPLFPGYVFIHEKILSVAVTMKKYFPMEFMKVVSFNGHPVSVLPKEMEWLFAHSNNDGTIKLSKGYSVGESVKIIQGPMKNFNGEILFINKKKQKAKVRLNLFNRDLEVSLGLDIINFPA